MSKRKHIGLKTKLAATLLRLGDVPYSDAKLMTPDQIISLYHFDHNIFHESGHPDVDKFWNIEPLLIQTHREKTRHDATVIAKGRRIRAKMTPPVPMLDGEGYHKSKMPIFDAAAETPRLRTGPGEFQRHAGHGVHDAAAPRPARSRLRSRGFDKTLRKKMDGTVVKR